MTNNSRPAKTFRYGKTIPAELYWLRGFAAPGELILDTMYSANRLRQLVRCGALVRTTTPGTYAIGNITDEMIASTRQEP